jgi:hypothetical protein
MAVHGTSQGFDGVVGETKSDAHAGVTGRNLTNGANGGVGIYGTGGRFAGKFDGNVIINGNASQGNALSVAGNASVIGQLGLVHGSALYALDVVGVVNVDGDILLSGSDCAEEFEVAAACEVEPGTVMVLSDQETLEAARNAYDKKVAGVISGAGEYRPGVILGRRNPSEKRMPLALAGRAYCKVDAQYGAIEAGDLLTTSPTPGHAMLASDASRAFGATIGKALRPLQSGQGLIPILVALQ